MRGDRPWQDFVIQDQEGFTPHARDRPPGVAYRAPPRVYPARGSTHHDQRLPDFGALPRMRGDRPVVLSLRLLRSRLPRMRIDLAGCALDADYGVYPACAIDPQDFSWRLPGWFPHAWGSTGDHLRELADACLPRMLGIDPAFQPFFLSLHCLPRMRGSTLLISSYKSYTTFTPHARSTAETC